MPPMLFGLALLMATLTGLAAAVAPALRAARLDPVVAIRA
jgi:lipoprotein-releasing system permease protein